MVANYLSIFPRKIGINLSPKASPPSPPLLPGTHYRSIPAPTGNNYISNSWRFFDVYVFAAYFALNLNSLTKICFVCVFVHVIRELIEEGARYVYLIQIDGAQMFSLMCMCIEFPILDPFRYTKSKVRPPQRLWWLSFTTCPAPP